VVTSMFLSKCKIATFVLLIASALGFLAGQTILQAPAQEPAAEEKSALEPLGDKAAKGKPAKDDTAEEITPAKDILYKSAEALAKLRGVEFRIELSLAFRTADKSGKKTVTNRLTRAHVWLWRDGPTTASDGRVKVISESTD